MPRPLENKEPLLGRKSPTRQEIADIQDDVDTTVQQVQQKVSVTLSDIQRISVSALQAASASFNRPINKIVATPAPTGHLTRAEEPSTRVKACIVYSLVYGLPVCVLLLAVCAPLEMLVLTTKGGGFHGDRPKWQCFTPVDNQLQKDTLGDGLADPTTNSTTDAVYDHGEAKEVMDMFKWVMPFHTASYGCIIVAIILWIICHLCQGGEGSPRSTCSGSSLGSQILTCLWFITWVVSIIMLTVGVYSEASYTCDGATGPCAGDIAELVKQGRMYCGVHLVLLGCLCCCFSYFFYDTRSAVAWAARAAEEA